MAEISTTSEFINMDTSVDNILVADLDFQGQEFNALGTLTATLDGNYHTISNFTISYDNVGTLFSLIDSGGELKRLTVDNATPQIGYAGGMLAGQIYGTGIIRDCKVMNSDIYIVSPNYAGVFAGRLRHDAVLENCFAVNITATNAGMEGAVDGVFENAVVSDCFYVNNSDINDNGQGTPLTDSEAKTASTYTGTGLDSSEWTIADGEYPVLGVQAQDESDGIHLPIGININSQTVLEYHSDGVQVDLSVDVNSQVILERHSNGNDVGLQIDINSQEVTESYSNGSNIDLNIEVSSQTIETFSKGSNVDLVINIEGDGRQTLDLIQETILLADLEKGITLEADRGITINLIGNRYNETNLNAEF